MPPRKNQHYIPKFCLRSFSVNNNQNQIGLFNLDNGFFRRTAALKHQGSEDYFYGNDEIVEEKLGELENATAPYFQRIMGTNSIPPKGTEAHGLIFLFTVILSARTKDAVAAMDELTSKTINEFMKYDESVRDKSGKYQITLNNSAAHVVIAAAGRASLANDLRLKLLINKTNTKFVFSDNPVIKYNQFLEQRKHPGGHTGIAAKELQIFFPVSPTYMLCLYDDWVYKIGNRSQDIVVLSEKKDIDELNKLQVLNCFDHLFFNHELSEHYIRNLFESVKSKRLKEYINLQQTNTFTDTEGRDHIQYMSTGLNIEINLNLSFIKQTRKAKGHVLSDYVVQLRDESIRGN